MTAKTPEMVIIIARYCDFHAPAARRQDGKILRPVVLITPPLGGVITTGPVKTTRERAGAGMANSTPPRTRAAARTPGRNSKSDYWPDKSVCNTDRLARFTGRLLVSGKACVLTTAIPNCPGCSNAAAPSAGRFFLKLNHQIDTYYDSNLR
jgi:hypothetical protein